MSRRTSRQFRLQTLFVIVTLITLVIASGAWLYRTYFFPTHKEVVVVADDVANSLIRAIDHLNREAELHYGHPEWILSKEELIGAIRSQYQHLPDRGSPDALASMESRVDRQFEKIFATELLPSNSKLAMSQTGIVTLQVPFDNSSGYGFIVRHPALERLSQSEQRLNPGWKPVPGIAYAWDGKKWKTEPKMQR